MLIFYNESGGDGTVGFPKRSQGPTGPTRTPKVFEIRQTVKYNSTEQRFCFRNGRSPGATVRAASERLPAKLFVITGHPAQYAKRVLHTNQLPQKALRHRESETHSSHPHLRYEVFFFLLFLRGARSLPLPATVAAPTISTMTIIIVIVRLFGECACRSLSRSLSLLSGHGKRDFPVSFCSLMVATWRLRDLSHSCGYYYYYNDDVKTQTNALWLLLLSGFFCFFYLINYFCSLILY